MSATYKPVQWTRSKIIYDVILVAGIVGYISIYLTFAPDIEDVSRSVNGTILRMRAYGTCAFLLLTIILCIGPLARLDRRFLPLLYNRRHFGVLTFIVAALHARHVLDWYFAFTPRVDWNGPLTGWLFTAGEASKYVELLRANTSFGQVLGFPFEVLGIIALIILLVMAVTSHDFWLSFLTAPVWKALHMSVYGAYALIVGHIALGHGQSTTTPVFLVVVFASVTLVCVLHVLAARKTMAYERLNIDPDARLDGYVEVCDFREIAEGRGKVVPVEGGERIAVFRHKGKIAAIGNACQHQNGPLGEGRVIADCVTCPWHGFQYRLEDGCSPPPFTEKVPTYRVKLVGPIIWIDPDGNPPGTYQEPVAIPEDYLEEGTAAGGHGTMTLSSAVTQGESR